MGKNGSNSWSINQLVIYLHSNISIPRYNCLKASSFSPFCGYHQDSKFIYNFRIEYIWIFPCLWLHMRIFVTQLASQLIQYIVLDYQRAIQLIAYIFVFVYWIYCWFMPPKIKHTIFFLFILNSFFVYFYRSISNLRKKLK